MAHLGGEGARGFYLVVCRRFLQKNGFWGYMTVLIKNRKKWNFDDFCKKCANFRHFFAHFFTLLHMFDPRTKSAFFNVLLRESRIFPKKFFQHYFDTEVKNGQKILHKICFREISKTDIFFPYQLIVMLWVLTFLCADFACAQLANVVQKSVYNIILSMIYHFFIFRRFWPFLTTYWWPVCTGIYPEDLHCVIFSGSTGAVSPLKSHFCDFFIVCTRKTSFCRKPTGNPVPKSYFSTKMFVPGVSENRFCKFFWSWHVV